MLYTTVALAVAGLAVTVGSSSSQPECVDKCWLNTQYVSQCGGDVRCLCEDGEFQNAVYQCLYSQCQTSQFGAALHHTLQVCNDQDKHVEEFEDSIAMPTVPALIRQQNEPLKKRAGMQSKSVSNSVSVSNPGRTYPSRGSQSVSASNYQTHSRARPSGGMSASVPYNSRSRAVSGSVLPTWTRNTMSVSANPTRSSSRAMQSVSAQPYYSSSRAMQSVSAQPYYSSSRALHSVSAQPYYSSSRALHSVSAQPYYHSSRAINPVSQISDGQVQAPTAVSYLVSQISDGQVQAPTPTPTSPISQISDGQIQGPTAYPSS